LIPVAAVLALAACGDSKPTNAQGAPGGPPGPAAPKKLGKKMPEFTPSGMKDDFKKWQELDGAVRNSKKEDEQTAATKALEDFLKEFPGRWEGKEVPAPEAFMYAHLLQKCKMYPQAINQVKRWIDVAPDDSVNYPNAYLALITCLALTGDYSGAESTLKEASETILKGRDLDRRGAEEAIANAMLMAGQLEPAANHFETLATTGFGDVDDAVLGVDCWLRLGRVDEALRFATRSSDFIKEGRAADRAKQLLKQVSIVGKPAAGFGGAKWWQGTGGPVTAENLKGKVTVVFTWNMKSNLNKWFFERLNLLIKDYADKPFQVVGISRLANFDPINMCTKKDMTEEDELKFYEMWCQQYGITYPLAVGAKDDDALVDAWAGYVVPYFVVVGKDGVVSYMRTGKSPEHYAALREMVDKALKK
jgi:tetratricopeptide (TPR) repeat protein